MSDDSLTNQSTSPRRSRPSRRVASSSSGESVDVLSEDMAGVSAAYGNTLLFIGYTVNGLVEIVVYPRYRFSGDDRVQGQLGNLRVPPGTSWQEILPMVDVVFEEAQAYYRRAALSRSREMRAHGSRYESAYDTIADIFRESWHGFALRLRRQGRIEKGNAVFEGEPPDPVLVTLGTEVYTLHVSPTGSIMMVTGDRRTTLSEP